MNHNFSVSWNSRDLRWIDHKTIKDGSWMSIVRALVSNKNAKIVDTGFMTEFGYATTESTKKYYYLYLLNINSKQSIIRVLQDTHYIKHVTKLPTN